MLKSFLIFQDNLFSHSNSLLVGLLCFRGDAGDKATNEMFLELLTQSIQKGLYLFLEKNIYLVLLALGLC